MNNSPSTIQDLSQERRAVAEAAFTNYEFGCQVSDAGQWREDENDRLTRVMTGCAEGETKRLTFHSEFFAGSATLIGVMAYDLDDGAEIGWPKGDVDKGFVSEEDDATENSARIKSIELGNIMIEDADDVELLNEALDEFAGRVFTIPEIDIRLDEAQYIHLSDMIGAASKLVGDGVGGELSVNCEYERGQVELICDLAGLSVEYRDQVRDAIHASARAQAVPGANA